MPSWAWLLDAALKILFGVVVLSLAVIIVYAVIKVMVNGGRS